METKPKVIEKGDIEYRMYFGCQISAQGRFPLALC
jgi:hypothetical protein